MLEDEVIKHEGKVKVINDLQDKIKHLNSRREVNEDKMEAKVAGQVLALSEDKGPIKLKLSKCVQKTRSSRMKMKLFERHQFFKCLYKNSQERS